ncbi:M3 family metallopeptidase [Methanolacinia paynteri]|uniref:M3 family metallopeptidase n=1 Tax=Methanolacinia paynteri TaxID=230356 RepID=UPI00064F36ED|nr:M3 family metallopeptidase [Methanolacinia paynteri]
MRDDITICRSRRILYGIFLSAFILSATGIFLPVLADDSLSPIRAEYSSGEITILSDEARETANESLNAIATIPVGERTFENTVVAFDSVLTDYGDAVSPLTIMGYLSPDPEIAAEGMDADIAQSKFYIEVYTRSDLYDALKSVEDKVPGTPVEQRLYKIIIDEFEHNGLGLPEENLTRVREMNAELSAIKTEFNSNLNNDNSSITFTGEELEGVPDEDLSSFSRTPEGDYIATVSQGYSTVMTYADSGDTRKRMYEAYNDVQGEANTPLLEEAIVLRENIAKEMRYTTWADYTIRNRMAENATVVIEFLDSLKEPLSEKIEEETAVILEIKQEIDPGATEIYPWDIRYLEHILIMRDYNYDVAEFKKYFPSDNVVDGVFNTTGMLFGVDFNEVQDAPVWSPDVRLFEVSNRSDNRTLGYLYLDLYHRDGKYTGYATSQLISGREKNGTYSLPVAIIIGSYDAPEGDNQTLFKPYDIWTMFHETGHAMNVILTTSHYGTLSGYKSSMDFCETPSQALEEWAYDPDVLESMSAKYGNSSEKIPEELAGQAIAARSVGMGYDYGYQVLFALVDMYYHTADGPVNTTKVWHDTSEEILGLDEPEGLHPAATFSHIMDQYDAGYYSYLWSKVYALDIVDEFKENGMTNETLGLKLRNDVYSQGNMADGMTLLDNFLGHEPGTDSLYGFIGLNVTGETAAA